MTGPRRESSRDSQTQETGEHLLEPFATNQAIAGKEHTSGDRRDERGNELSRVDDVHRDEDDGWQAAVDHAPPTADGAFEDQSFGPQLLGVTGFRAAAVRPFGGLSVI